MIITHPQVIEESDAPPSCDGLAISFGLGSLVLAAPAFVSPLVDMIRAAVAAGRDR